MENRIITMLQAVDTVTKSAKGSHLSDDFVKGTASALAVISDKLGTNETQSLMMALFIQHAFDRQIEINSVFEGTDSPTSRMLELMNDVEWLVDNHYLLRTKDRWGNKAYKISSEAVSAFQHNCKFVRKEYKKVSARALFFVLEELFESRDNEEISFSHLVREVNQLFDVNKGLQFVQKIRTSRLDETDKMLLVVFCHLFVSNSDDRIVWDDLKFLYDDSRTSMTTRSALYDDSHPLIRANIIENTNDGGFVNKETH